MIYVVEAKRVDDTYSAGSIRTEVLALASHKNYMSG
jgi:hypothetical protein